MWSACACETNAVSRSSCGSNQRSNSGRRIPRSKVTFIISIYSFCKVNLVCRLAYNGDVIAFKMGRRLGKRSAGRRIGVRGNKAAFRHGYIEQEVSSKLMTLCKRPHADPPTRRYVSSEGGQLSRY